jgi:hypothetical protein
LFDFNVLNWFPTSKNFYQSPFSKWPPQYRKNSTTYLPTSKIVGPVRGNRNIFNCGPNWQLFLHWYGQLVPNNNTKCKYDYWQTSRINTYLQTFQKGNEQAINTLFIQFYFKQDMIII